MLCWDRDIDRTIFVFTVWLLRHVSHESKQQGVYIWIIFPAEYIAASAACAVGRVYLSACHRCHHPHPPHIILSNNARSRRRQFHLLEANWQRGASRIDVSIRLRRGIHANNPLMYLLQTTEQIKAESKGTGTDKPE